MSVESLDQKQIDELMNNLSDVNFEDIEQITRKVSDIKTYRIPFVSKIISSKIIKNKNMYILILKFENNKFFIDYYNKQIIKHEIFTYEMRNFMFLSVPFIDFLEPLRTHSRTSWKIEEEDRIKVKIKVAQ